MMETACFEMSEETQYTVLCKNSEDQLLLHIFVFSLQIITIKIH